MSFNETFGAVVDVIVKNAEAMSQLVDSRKTYSLRSFNRSST